MRHRPLRPVVHPGRPAHSRQHLITGCKSSKAAAGESPEIGTETPVMAPDVLPEFPGGFPALQEYLRNHVIYPEKSQKEGTQGRWLCSSW